jgi:hypothetical protein
VVATSFTTSREGLFTCSVSFAALPVPPFAEVTLPVVLFFKPLVVAVTSTETVHDPLAAMVPPVKVRVVSDAAGANVGVPQDEEDALGSEAT